MEIQKVSVKKLNPAKYNPRKDLKPGDPEYEKLKRSIETFGYVELVIWNKRTGINLNQREEILRIKIIRLTNCAPMIITR